MEWHTDQYVTAAERTRDDGTVLAVTLDRPAKRNALPFDTVGTLTALFEQVDREEVDAVVVRGEGEHFSSGMDVAAATREQFLDPDESGSVHDLVAAVRDAPVPVLAAVEGNAYGTGFFLCMAADFVVAAPDATFALPEVTLGMPAGAYTPALLPQLVGERRARDWLLTGRTVGAEEADQAGFVTTVTTTLDEAVEDLLDTLLANGGLAISLLKDELATLPADREAVKQRETEAMRTAWTEGDVADRLAELF
ncbi:MAG: enoyl-CoA hydratase/isomerase family protein [Halorientalis sp.]